MIGSVATFSLSRAREYLGRRWPERHPFADKRRAWVGFDTCSDDQSPLARIFDGTSLVVRCLDWDVDNVNRSHGPAPELAPTIGHARDIVRFVLGLHRSPDEYVLCVHCHAGLFRSGAVAEWVRVDLGVTEHECSNRLVDVVTGEGWSGDRTYNETLLRLLREAHAETKRENGGEK